MLPYLTLGDLWLTAAHPVGQLWIALINGSQRSKVILKVMLFLWESEQEALHSKYL